MRHRRVSLISRLIQPGDRLFGLNINEGFPQFYYTFRNTLKCTSAASKLPLIPAFNMT